MKLCINGRRKENKSMKQLLVICVCVLLSCSMGNSVKDGTVHHFKSIDRKSTRYYVEIGTRGSVGWMYQYFTFVDRTGKYAVGDTIVYMVKSEF